MSEPFKVGDVCEILPCELVSDKTYGIFDGEEIVIVGQEREYTNTPDRNPVFGFAVKFGTVNMVINRRFLRLKKRGEDCVKAAQLKELKPEGEK